ncbi:VanZ family protein [Actinoplanes sichuanensis]|uniref:VanZ family protein n=1 Tax=Actinoplanes sichuanensis TaxID=512349 RepID=A0ABW4AME2_9ACTN|nr:VanZ family protein [Actinoplanes sichuanensis]
MVVSLVVLHRRGELTPLRVIVFWLAGWYAVAVVGATLLPMSLAWGPGAAPPDVSRILWVPILDMRKRDFVLNTLMTVPLATVLYVVFGVRDWGRVVRTGFLLGLVIELTQLTLLLTLNGLRWADVHDVVSNTFGAAFGYVLLWRLMRFARFRRVVESCVCGRIVRTGRDAPATAR